MNGFDLSDIAVERSEIVSGGPPRDGIPSIDKPQFIPVERVDFLKDDDIVIGLAIKGTARAYPTRILVWHEIVNDVVAGQAVAVTYCPLCGTAMVFHRGTGVQTRSFGVSGLLYRSDVLMYDRESESLWSQLAKRAISGPALGEELVWLPSEHLTWKAWREKYPEGEVLSKETGHHRNYGGKAYASYFSSDTTMFPVPHTRTEFANKAWVIGVVIDGAAKAYPVEMMPDGKEIQDRVGQQQITISYDAEKRFPQVSAIGGEVIPSVMAFWFAWQAFYPDTEVWTP